MSSGPWTQCPVCGDKLEATLTIYVDLDSYDPLTETIGPWTDIPEYGTEAARVYCHNDCDWEEAIERKREEARRR